MNKSFVLFLVFVAAAIYYYKTQQPQIDRETVQQPAVQKTEPAEEIQSQLPEDARGMVAEIKTSEQENEKMDSQFYDEEKEKEKEEIDKRNQRSTKINEFIRNNPASEIPILPRAPGAPLKWPCANATLEQIAHSFNIVWGPKSPEPHDKSWYFAISNGITDYLICRSASLTQSNSYSAVSDICLGAEIYKDYKDAKDIFKSCRENMYLFNVYMYVLGKGSKEECQKFPMHLKEVDICTEVKKHRGKNLCSSLNLKKGTPEYTGCMKYFPAEESDCASLFGPDANICRGNLSLFNAIKTNDPKLCPAGKTGVACLSYFSRSVQEPCAKYMNKLSTDFCSGGKYAKTRTISFEFEEGHSN